jgi:hypothetical protein
MPTDYSGHYDLNEALELEPNILQSPTLCDWDTEKILAAALDKLAHPLSDGTKSPFSSRNPLSAHGQLMGVLAYIQDLLGHELNLVPDSLWVRWFRLLGVESNVAERPVISLRFTRSQDAIVSGIVAKVPMGTNIRSMINSELVATTLYDLEITENETTGSIPARLNVPGKISPEIRVGEFSLLPELLNWIDYVGNDGTVLFEGREAETLPETMLRARQEFQTGWRLDTARDFYRTVLSLGAKKVAVLPQVKKGSNVKFNNLITIAVYPGNMVELIKDALSERMPLCLNLDVIPANIIPIDGEIDVRIIPSLSNDQAFNIAARAIQTNVNPPFGSWGDKTFISTVATALENQPASIYAVPNMRLKHADTDVPLTDLDIKPWDLLEIQSSITFNWMR